MKHNLIKVFGETKMINSMLEMAQGTTLYLDTAQIKKITFFLKNISFLKYNMVLDCWGVNLIEKADASFQVNYMLCNIKNNSRLFLKIALLQDSLGLVLTDSLTMQFPAISWFERETWDLFGIVFKEHPDLRRLLTDYGFDGYPLRKDFPVCGYFELKYNTLKGTLIYVPIKLNQEYRYFTLENPWV